MALTVRAQAREARSVFAWPTPVAADVEAGDVLLMAGLLSIDLGSNPTNHTITGYGGSFVVSSGAEQARAEVVHQTDVEIDSFGNQVAILWTKVLIDEALAAEIVSSESYSAGGGAHTGWLGVDDTLGVFEYGGVGWWLDTDGAGDVDITDLPHDWTDWQTVPEAGPKSDTLAGTPGADELMLVGGHAAGFTTDGSIGGANALAATWTGLDVAVSSPVRQVDSISWYATNVAYATGGASETGTFTASTADPDDDSFDVLAVWGGLVAAVEDDPEPEPSTGTEGGRFNPPRARRRVDIRELPVQIHTGMLGLPGLTERRGRQ